MDFQDLDLIKGYHVHVYFDESTIEQARLLCEESGERFQVAYSGVQSYPAHLVLVGQGIKIKNCT